MSKDARHIPWAFSLSTTDSLPLTGELHPITRELPRRLLWSCGATLLLGLLVFGSWHLWSRLRPEAPPAREVRIVRYTDLGVPPSISTPASPQLAIAQAVSVPSIGIPEPVPDELATSPTIATISEMTEALAPITLSDLGLEGGDSLVVDLDVHGGLSPDDFVAVDEEPIRISMDPPRYPEVAQSAGVEGTVIINALVGKDGRVKECIVVDGPQALVDAALQSAQSAVFRPALHRRRPIELWVMMPITFKLN